MTANGQGFDEGVLLWGEIWRMVQFSGQNGKCWPQATVAVDPKGLVMLTAVRLAETAGVALLAVDVGFHATAVARFHVGHIGADGDHLDAKFMAGNAWVTKKWHFAEVATVVGPTDADCLHADECLSWARCIRLGQIDHVPASRFGQL
jgi:hypothetical protein